MTDKGTEGTAGKTYTVDEALSNAGFGWFHWKLLFICGALYACEAIEVMLLTFLMPIIQDIWDLQDPWDSMIGVVFFIGGLFGALTFPKLSDVHGRRKVIIYCAIILSVAGTVMAFVTNLYSLLICRFFSGAGLSGMVVSTTLFQEYIPVHNRGKMIVLEQQFWSYGSIFSALLAWITLPNIDEDIGWRYYVGLSTIPVWMVTICSYWIPESIRYHCTVGEFVEAEKKIQQVLLTNGKEPIEGRLVRTEKITFRGKVKDLFVPKYKLTSILMIINFMIGFAVYYGIAFVSERLFVNASLYVCEFVTACSELPALGVALFIDKIGRKDILLYTWILNIIGFSLIAIFWLYSYEYLLVIVVFVVRLSSLVNNVALMIYFTEYYPTAIRTTALGTAYAMSRISVAAFTFISEDVDIVTANLLFCASSVIAFICTFFVPEDTTGKILTNHVDRADCLTTGPDRPITASKNSNMEKYVTIV